MSDQNLNCDICGAQMTHYKQGDTDVFKCTKCEQSWGFSPNQTTRLILHSLYPQKMKPEMKHEYLDYKLSEYLFKQKALLISGKITKSEFDERKLEAEKEIEKQHQLVPKKKRFWIF